jgi:tetratricopeptide (TPR) repeat protein
MKQSISLSKMLVFLAAAALINGVTVLLPTPAQAQQLLEEQGTLRPAQDEYSFTGEAGQTVAVTMSSEAFDTVLVLMGPDGQELAYNDDFARSLNSTIVIELPSSGTYKVLARSLDGSGGQYTIAVRPATPFEQAYSRASELYFNGNYVEAINAFTQVIELDPEQPVAYWDRADARMGQFYSEQNPESPEAAQPPAELKAAVLADYERAIALYEQAGDTEKVQILRDQMTWLQQQ